MLKIGVQCIRETNGRDLGFLFSFHTSGMKASDGLEKCRRELDIMFWEGNFPLLCQSKFKIHMPISH